MNLQKIEELWAKDAEAFADHRELPELLANDSMETPRLHAKYLQLHNEFKLMMSDAQTKYKKLYKDKWLYYNGKAPSSVYAENPCSSLSEHGIDVRNQRFSSRSNQILKGSS